MSITSISSANSFTGAPDPVAQSIALNKALNKAKKRERNHRLAYLSIPAVAGVAAAALTKGNSKILGKEIAGRAAKLSEGIKNAGDWGVLLGSIATIGLGERALANKSEGYRNFRVNHPILSFFGDAALILGAIMAIPLAGNKVFSKLSPELQSRIGNKVGDWATKLNNFKTPKFLTDLGKKISDHTPEIIKNGKDSIVKSIPDGLKDIGKTIASLSPHILLFGTFFSQLAIPARMRADYEKEYKKIVNM